MRRINIVPALVLSGLLLSCLIAVYITRNLETATQSSHKSAAHGASAATDSTLLETARRLAAQADTADEQEQMLEAEHLADHEIDQAFTAALREATAYQVPASGPLHDLSVRIQQLQAQITADQTAIGLLSKDAGTNSGTDQLEIAKARLALDQDELGDAQQDLARQGGDPHSALERALEEHQATQHQAVSAKSATVSSAATLSQQIRSWYSLGSRNRDILAAASQATGQATALAARHSEIEKRLDSSQSGAATEPTTNTAARIGELRRRSDQRKTLAELDQRIQDCQQLAAVYKTASSSVEARQASILHLILRSCAEILAVLLVAFLANLTIRHAFQRSDRKRGHQAPLMATVAVEVAALALVLLVIFGAPSQLSTFIGLATAGLTVALKDFIIALFGWFVLMGKNGIRVGDWVEINGVGGEVIQIGLLKTVLLELGNTASGHPTGRQVTFSNGFAMEGHYFNFSTSGQWLWDELVVMLPPASDPYLAAQEIRKVVEGETQLDSVKATEDWERVTSRYGARNFSAQPAVDMRPGANGLEVVVRYITRAPERYVMKSKLLKLIVDLLYKPASELGQAVS